MQTIDSVFENENIYQSILFVDSDTKVDLYEQMYNADYPVVQYSDSNGLSRFLDCNSRCLIVSNNDLTNFMMDTNPIWNNVNMVVSCNNIITIEQLGIDTNTVSFVAV